MPVFNKYFGVIWIEDLRFVFIQINTKENLVSITSYVSFHTQLKQDLNASLATQLLSKI